MREKKKGAKENRSIAFLCALDTGTIWQIVPVMQLQFVLVDQLQRELNLPRREGAGDFAEAAGVIAVRVKRNV
jgi:hypothetical protein